MTYCLKAAIYYRLFRSYIVKFVSFVWICFIFENLLRFQMKNQYDIKLFSDKKIIFLFTVKIDFTKHNYLCTCFDDKLMIKYEISKR